MPVPTSTAPPPLFPTLTRSEVDAARTSAWYDTFEDLTTPATVINIDALDERAAFLEWIESDSIFIPEDAGAEPSHEDAPKYHLPALNKAIRAAIDKYGAVFPKLNWTSPRDAAFILPQGHGPLHSTSPHDIYLLLKSSDFVQHDLDPISAYEGVPAADIPSEVSIELVLKKFTEMNPSQEVRCFVRDDILLGITQRDTNFYEHYQGADEQAALVSRVREFYEDEICENYAGGANYVFDLYLADSGRITVTDFQPYRGSTDPLLFSYEELNELLASARASPSTSDEAEAGAERLPELRVIDSRAHPAANTGPAFGANMLPVEAVQMSEGQTASDFALAWQEAMAQGMGRRMDELSDDEPDLKGSL
ncbi:hypothetical protein CcaverHIS002_0510240 [Cutaneotrichosporon cavernicola]|uniref:Cell division cycle protein 123 n=1 Tax=Cutaneotrichosporon cavernicola TaxID=279322 RepID=A0AA48QXL0_9TREE|nr:uncharacterized protein CcaverHIS019_0510800 [Cutaneotrichosporon cavernicola]BEI85623.1 hypothetical protein CcaverHIS002_0510240 [Cutaneotrichosporon cavernicola]BEI93452.1 hypothetical protein CcaverHIS019_0510800 [Cutaneotrichosporon cavernicola]BEJ01230.1 hypothetical protein CcaverHIS631_0510870 [Cutaneotrichosporon cavernicola]BEJ08999.1 hypothetical protein CcaverHIS641_0510930 [Cutaneotrichosporon cavernicola]